MLIALKCWAFTKNIMSAYYYIFLSEDITFFYLLAPNTTINLSPYFFMFFL